MSARALILSTWSVSVSNNKITQTSGLNSFFFFLIVLEVGESKIKVSANLALDEDSPPGLKMTICILTEQSGRKLRCLLSGHWSDHRGSTLVTSSKPNYLPKAIHPNTILLGIQFSSVQSLSHVRLYATPWTAACQASLSTTNSWSLLKLMSIESMMPSNHLILCRPLLIPPSIFSSIRVFSNESVLHIRWPKYWSFNIGD